VISDELFEFIPMCLFYVDRWGSSVGVANGSKMEIYVNGNVVGTQTCEGAPFTYEV